MSIIANIFKAIMVERPAKKHGFTGWADAIEKDGDALAQKLTASADSPDNRKVLSHIIGIERWAQSRAKVTLGAPFVQDEYNNYRPARNATWADMQSQFTTTRADSVILARDLESASVPFTTTVKHNDFGDLTIRGWLRYIFIHGSFEARRIK